MQGLFVGDEQTPSECLKRHLSRDLKARVEVLNTGHLGYSPEQEYYTLREYADRFRPRFVVLNLFANDFGDLFEVLDGKGDWEEGKYWLGQITQFCRTRGLICLTVPAPWVNQLEGQRRAIDRLILGILGKGSVELVVRSHLGIPHGAAVWRRLLREVCLPFLRPYPILAAVMDGDIPSRPSSL